MHMDSWECRLRFLERIEQPFTSPLPRTTIALSSALDMPWLCIANAGPIWSSPCLIPTLDPSEHDARWCTHEMRKRSDPQASYPPFQVGARPTIFNGMPAVSEVHLRRLDRPDRLHRRAVAVISIDAPLQDVRCPPGPPPLAHEPAPQPTQPAAPVDHMRACMSKLTNSPGTIVHVVAHCRAFDICSKKECTGYINQCGRAPFVVEGWSPLMI